jgi:tetratricopeptide (TPR) repeat protein
MDATDSDNKKKAAAPESPPSGQVILTADEALEFARQLHRDGSLDPAENLYRRVIAAAPENVNALHYLGVLCHQQNRNAEAAESIERITILDPQNADAHNNLGNALRKSGEIEEAVDAYQKVVELNPNHVGAQQRLARTLLQADHRDKAAEVFEEWLRKESRNPVIL